MIINGVFMLPIALILIVCFIQQIRENIRISCEEKPKAREHIEIKMTSNQDKNVKSVELDGFWDGYLAGNM